MMFEDFVFNSDVLDSSYDKKFFWILIKRRNNFRIEFE